MLLPGGRLPLNIFEPRFVRMVDDAMGSDRLIGMVQPSQAEERMGGTSPLDSKAGIFGVGCAGKITQFVEEDGRYRIMLTGLSRFHIGEDIASLRGYRRIVPDWTSFAQDLQDDSVQTIDRPRLIAGVRSYFQLQGLSTDWSAVEQAPDDQLVTSLAMGCPFEPAEKQALLEAPDLAARASVLTGLIEMAVLSRNAESDAIRH